MTVSGITVVVPTIPPRRAMLARALASVGAQQLSPDTVVIENDWTGRGAAATRDAGLRRVTTDWVAFLDDDDEFYPQHLAALHAHAIDCRADYVYAWFDLNRNGLIDNTADPLGHYGRAFDPAHPTQTTITVLVRTELAQQVGFATPRGDGLTPERLYAGEDWSFTLGCLNLGAKIVHLPERTWVWHHHGANTSGLARAWHPDPAQVIT